LVTGLVRRSRCIGHHHDEHGALVLGFGNLPQHRSSGVAVTLNPERDVVINDDSARKSIEKQAA
jgi:hypothetical protein